jgi:hypothetical protein
MKAIGWLARGIDMAEQRTPTQGMPKDGRKGADDGVNTQGEEIAEGADKARARRRRNSNKDQGVGGGFMEHGGQSGMGYHGPQQLGDDAVKRGGNRNAGAKTK